MPLLRFSIPIRELMSIHADRKGAGKDSITRAIEAAELVHALSDAGAAFFSDSPAYTSYVEHMKKQDPTYLAHEYLNKNWHASYFFEIAKKMATTGCSFVTSANILESTLIVQPEKTQAFLGTVSDPISWESLKNFNPNTSFRRDIFYKSSLPHDSGGVERAAGRVLLESLYAIAAHQGTRRQSAVRRHSAG